MRLADTFMPDPRILFRRWGVWCLAIALAVYGLAGSLDAMLGPVHVHRVAATDADPLAGWQDFRRVDHVGESAIRNHSHDAFGRHRHPLTDHSVLALGSDHQDDGAGGGSSSAQQMAFVSVSTTLGPMLGQHVASADWRVARVAAFESCDARRLERPPSARLVLA